MLDLKQWDIVVTPYLNAQISDSSDSEEYVKSTHNLLEADHKVYFSMSNNEQDMKFKHPSQFHEKYRWSLKHHCFVYKFIFLITPTQVENEHDFSIAGVFGQAWKSSLTIKSLAMLTFVKIFLQLHYQLNYEDLKDEDIDLMEEYLKSKNGTI